MYIYYFPYTHTVNTKKKKVRLSPDFSVIENKTRRPDTFGKSIKLGRAVEISPSVFKEQFTSCDSISQAASADSLLLSTLEKKHHYSCTFYCLFTFFPKYPDFKITHVYIYISLYTYSFHRSIITSLLHYNLKNILSIIHPPPSPPTLAFSESLWKSRRAIVKTRPSFHYKRYI